MHPLQLPDFYCMLCSIMSETGKERFILTKSYEIAYALFRIAGTIGERDFAERLRATGAGILEAAAVEDFAAARKPLQAIEALVKFAGDVNIMTLANADLLLREVYVLDAAVVERMNAAKAPALDLSEIFSAEPVPPAEDPAPASAETADPYGSNPANAASVAESMNPANAANMTDASRQANGSRNGSNAAYAAATGNTESVGFLRADVRQATILDRIRQSGNCRIKELQEALPGCSERTLRYDLQSLLERNLIERIGNGGPAVSYRMRQTA